MLKRLSLDTGHLINASSSWIAIILSICARASPPSFSFSSPNWQRISAPTMIECCSKRVLSVVKYLAVLFLLVRWMKRELESVLASICWTFVSFSVHTVRSLVYSATTSTSSGVFAVYPLSCPTAGSMGLGIVPWRYLLSPQLAMTIWSWTFQVAHFLPDVSSLGSLISSDVVVLIMMNTVYVRHLCVFLTIRVQGS